MRAHSATTRALIFVKLFDKLSLNIMLTFLICINFLYIKNLGKLIL